MGKMPQVEVTQGSRLWLTNTLKLLDLPRVTCWPLLRSGATTRTTIIIMSWVNSTSRLNSSRYKKLRQAPQKEGGEKKEEKKYWVAFPLCDPGWCVHILTERYSLASRVNGMTKK